MMRRRFTACCAGRIPAICTSSRTGRHLSHPAENIYELYCCVQILTILAADFIGQTTTSGSARLWRAAWSEFIFTVSWMVVYSTPSWEIAIVWNQPKASAPNVAIDEQKFILLTSGIMAILFHFGMNFFDIFLNSKHNRQFRSKNVLIVMSYRAS